MVNAKDFYSGNFLKAEDCKGGEICEILDEGEITEITNPEGKTKAVLNFQVQMGEFEKTFTPNKSNGNILVDAFGEDTGKWVGKRFKINLTKVRVFGKMKPSIVVEPLDVVETQKVQEMLITNATGFKLRFSIARAISEDEMEEVFAYVIAKGCSLNIPEGDNFTISIEEEK